MRTAISCLVQPIDRDYRVHGKRRVVHLEVLDEPVTYAIRTSVIPFVVCEVTQSASNPRK